VSIVQTLSDEMAGVTCVDGWQAESDGPLHMRSSLGCRFVPLVVAAVNWPSQFVMPTRNIHIDVIASFAHTYGLEKLPAISIDKGHFEMASGPPITQMPFSSWEQSAVRVGDDWSLGAEPISSIGVDSTGPATRQYDMETQQATSIERGQIEVSGAPNVSLERFSCSEQLVVEGGDRWSVDTGPICSEAVNATEPVTRRYEFETLPATSMGRGQFESSGAPKVAREPFSSLEQPLVKAGDRWSFGMEAVSWIAVAAPEPVTCRHNVDALPSISIDRGQFGISGAPKVTQTLLSSSEFFVQE
jgi:hypothetical protein